MEHKDRRNVDFGMFFHLKQVPHFWHVSESMMGFLGLGPSVILLFSGRILPRFMFVAQPHLVLQCSVLPISDVSWHIMNASVVIFLDGHYRWRFFLPCTLSTLMADPMAQWRQGPTCFMSQSMSIPDFMAQFTLSITRVSLKRKKTVTCYWDILYT